MAQIIVTPGSISLPSSQFKARKPDCVSLVTSNCSSLAPFPDLSVMSGANTQTALVLPEKFGKLVLTTLSVYKPGKNEVLVKVHSTALNPVDWKIQQRGIYSEVFPHVLGSDIAGEVVELGEGVSRFSKGDKV
jgi:triacylglycerol esterase/lipase EstA (alpha/beta hydrolase family)